MADAGRDRRARAAGRAARRDAGVARILGVAMDQVGGEPAIGKRRAVGAAENHGAGLAQIVDHRAVGLRDHVALQLQPVGGGKAFLVDIDLDRDRHAAKRTGILAARDRGIDGRGLRQHVRRPVVDHGVDLRIDRVEPRQRRRRRLLRRDLLRFDQRSHIRSRQTPEIFHAKLRFDGRPFSAGARAMPAGAGPSSAPDLAHTGDEIGEIGDLLRRDRRHHVGHGAVIAVAAVVLVLGKGLGEIILALVGDARDVLLAGKIRACGRYCSGAAAPAPAPRCIRAGSPASAGGAGFGNVAMKSEKTRRSSSVSGFAISFIGSKVRSFSRNMNSWISA